MSTVQTDLSQFNSSSPKHPENSGRGQPKSEQTGRSECGFERYDGGECRDPVMPGGFGRCWRHLHADEEDESETEGKPVWERHRDELLDEGE